jgi:hypothetical protein
VRVTKNISIEIRAQEKLMQDGTCKDCIFWYQCRQGKVDCHVKQK